MTDRIDFGSEPWQAIPRRILRDPNISYRAKGGLVALLSHEEGWVRSAISTLMHEGRCGRKQAQAIMAELREHGYAELVQDRAGNLIKSRYVIYAIPESATFQPSFVNSSDLPETGPARTGSTGARSAVVEALDVEPNTVEPKEPKALLATLDFFDVFWGVYPRHEGRAEAKKALDKALRKTDLETIVGGAIRYRDDPNREDGFTAHAATWLNQERWDDDPLPARTRKRVGQSAELLKLAMED